jgi:hypothetical protein
MERRRFNELPYWLAVELARSAVAFYLGRARGTAAGVYLKDALELVCARVNLEKPRVGDRILFKYIVEKELSEVVDGKGRKWRLVELKLTPGHPKRGMCTRALYEREPAPPFQALRSSENQR